MSSDGVVDAAVRVTVNVAGRALLVRVVGGVAGNFVDKSVDIVGLVNEATDVVVLVEDPRERENVPVT